MKSALIAAKKDITRTLISSAFVCENINTIFPDSLFITSDFKILTMTDSIQQLIEFNKSEFEGKPISMLAADNKFEERLQHYLWNGYFNGKKINVQSKSGTTVLHITSGFYLGILADCEGVIVLRCVPLKRSTELKYLHEGMSPLNDFASKAAKLRGPLTTIQRLVSLLKIRKDDSEIDQVIQLIGTYGDILEERLRQLAPSVKLDGEQEL